MGENMGSSSTRQGGRLCSYLTDISLEYTPCNNEDRLGLSNITEIVIFGMDDAPDGKHLPVTKASLWRWKVENCIELPTESSGGITIIAKSGEDEDLGFVQLDGVDMQTVALQSEHSRVRKMETCNQQLHLTISWDICTIPYYSAMLYTQGRLLLESFERGDHCDIAAASQTLQMAVDLTPAGSSDLPSRLNKLGHSLNLCFRYGGNLSVIAEAILVNQKAADLACTGHPDFPTFLNDLGTSFHCRFVRTYDCTDIAKAVLLYQRAVKISPANHPDLPRRLNNLAIAAGRGFECTNDLSYITEAISAAQRAVSLLPTDHPDYSAMLNNLGLSLRRRFEHTSDLNDITNAISALQEAIELLPASHPDFSSWLTNLGSSFFSRFQCMGNLSDIDRAISILQQAVNLTTTGHPELPTMLANLGQFFCAQYANYSNLSDISEAILRVQQAVKLTPPGHPGLPSRLYALVDPLRLRFEHTKDPSDIAQAISAIHRAIDMTPACHPDLSGMLHELAVLLRCHFEHKGNISDITEGILAAQRAVKLTSQQHPDLFVRIAEIGTCFARRFEHKGSISDITEGISALRQSVKLAPAGNISLPNILNSLGLSLMSHYIQTGNLSNIAEAIPTLQRAAQLTPADDSNLPGILMNLGNAFRARFETTNDLPDITEAIVVLQQALKLTSAGHPDLCSVLGSLGIAFQWRSKHTGDLDDITEGISATQRAVNLTPIDNPGLPRVLNVLGILFYVRFGKTLDISDANKAISAGQKAIELTPADHPLFPGCLNNLANGFRARWCLTKSNSDIAEAAAITLKAMKLTPPGHPELPAIHSNLADLLHFQAVTTNQSGNLMMAITHYRTAATCSFGAPTYKLCAAKHLVDLLLTSSGIETRLTLDAFDIAIGLISSMAGLERTVQSRHTHLQVMSDLPLQAAAVACSLGRADKALEWLEQGRCLVWTQLNQLRTPLDSLWMHDEVLAQHILDVSIQLENAGSRQGFSHDKASISEKISIQDDARVHLELALEWKKLLSTVRSSIPGFENFLQPSPCSTLLQHLPDSGPIVVISIHKSRCDAIALLKGLDEPLHIPLPTFSQEKADEHHHNLTTHLKSHQLRMRAMESDTENRIEQLDRAMKPAPPERSHQEDVICTILRGLWIDVVKPILANLGFPRVESFSKDALPRIWWCPTGTLSFLPLHAAGIYGARNSESILDYAISSYTPTITSLTTRVMSSCTRDKKVASLFLTSQPNVPGVPSIPGTSDEVRLIHECAVHHGVKVLKCEGSDITIKEALGHMKDYSSIHFACHASQNAREPLRSRFLFHNGSLDLATIIQQNFKNADLAFLSACQTSTGEEKLSEEAVHLAAGMLAAGYNSVVATMWAIGDHHAPSVANDFYKYLWSHKEEGSRSGMDASLSACALHHAIQQLRQRLDNSEKSFLTWIPYVHFGL